MPNLDLIEASLSRPMDWGAVEKLVYDILVQDDLPTLRRIGGVGDEGVDAIDEAFYEDEQRTETVVQITSEQAQVGKFNRTVKRLRECGITFDLLVIVYRHPVSGDTRRKVREAADSERISVDIRDQSYLIAQLAKLENGIFARHFQDIRTQVNQLLDEGDPLKNADGRLRHAMLASLAAYVLNKDARVVRTTLFDRTVIAVLVANQTDLTNNELASEVSKLLPGDPISDDRIASAIDRLETDGLCIRVSGGRVKVSESAVEVVGTALVRIRAAFEQMLNQLVKDISKFATLNDAQRGYVERNVRRALTYLVQLVEPTGEFDAEASAEISLGEKTFQQMLGKDLNDAVARSSLLSMIKFVQDPANAEILSTLARSYSSLRLRNMDPLGKRWQAANLSRSQMLLDTDVVLLLIIEELPDHPPLLAALRALQAEGVKLIVPKGVIIEAAGHISRADRTYNRFGEVLGRMRPEMADAIVWYAVVRGFYYSKSGSSVNAFLTYWKKYYDRDDPAAYVQFLLQNRIKCEILSDFSVSGADQSDAAALSASVMHEYERGRMKAPFRDESQMEQRTDEHVAYAL
jgi:hypothetical protein